MQTLTAVKTVATTYVSPVDKFRGAVTYFIEERRNIIRTTTPAVGEAFRDVSYEARQIRRHNNSFPQAPDVLVESHGRRNSRPAINRASKAQPPARDLLKIYRVANDEEDSFKAAAQEFKQNATKKTKLALALVDPFSGGHSWSSVIESVQGAAEDRYKASNFRRKIARTIATFLTNNADTLKSWQDLLPQGSEYFSVICGFLKLIFGAAAVLGDISEAICKSIERIPEVITRALDLTALFKASGLSADSKLYTKSATLMASMYHLMNEVLLELNKNWFKRELVAFFKQDRYGQGLIKASTKVDDDLMKFIDIAQDYGLALTADNNTRLMTVESKLDNIGDDAHAIAANNRQMHMYNAQQLQQGFYDNDVQLTILQQQQLEVMRRQAESDARAIVMAQQLREILTNTIASNGAVDFDTGEIHLIEQEARRMHLNDFTKRKMSIARHYTDDALDKLNYDKATITDDAHRIISRALQMNRKQQDRAIAVLEDPNFQEWIMTTTSSVLSINANCLNPQENEPSSYASAKLSSAIAPLLNTTKSQEQRPLCLSFFCAEHTGSGDLDSGPAGMMRSMVCQLMSQYSDWNLDTLRGIQDCDPEDSSDLLARGLIPLLRELPANIIVFLVIDSIVRFEDSKSYMGESARLVKDLVDLLEDAHGFKAKLKLLFMDPARCLMLRQNLMDDEQVVIDEMVPQTEGLMLSTLIDTLGTAARRKLIA